jgi:hypothetical protein
MARTRFWLANVTAVDRDLGERVAGGGVDVGQDDCRALADEQFGLGGPLPAGGAGDQRWFAGKPGHFRAALRLPAG